MPLPTINLPTPVITSAVAAKTYNAAFMPSFTFSADPDPSKPWPAKAVFRAYDPATAEYADIAVINIAFADVRVDSVVYPAVGAEMVSFLGTMAKVFPAKLIEQQISDQLAVISKSQQSITSQQATLAAANAAPDSNPNKATAITRITTNIATLQGAIDTANTLAWVTLLAAWRTAAASLGVTDAHALPPQLVGLTPPNGVTV